MARRAGTPARRTDGANSTADRAIDILLLFSSERPTWSAGDIATTFGMPRSTTYRYLNTLRSYALIVEDDHGGFRLGPRILPLARAAKANLSVIKLAAPAMASLAEEFGELVVLHERVGSEIIPLERIESGHRVTIASTRSHLLPWPATGSAKILLAHAPEAERDQLLKMMKPVLYTDRTLRDKPSLLKALEDIRRDGYAITDEERDPGVWGIAAPIVSRSGVRHCVALAIPRFRVHEKRKVALIRSVQRAAAQIGEAVAATEI